MNFKFYREKLIGSEEYKKFEKENPKAYPCSGFFIIDKTGKEGNKIHFDFFIPGHEKIYSFGLEKGIELSLVDTYDKRVPKEVSLNHDFDFEEFEGMIEKKKQEKAIKGDVQKFLFSFQNLKGKDYLVTTVFLNNLALLKVQIDVKDKKIIDFEKKSFLDMMKIIKKK